MGNPPTSPGRRSKPVQTCSPGYERLASPRARTELLRLGSLQVSPTECRTYSTRSGSISRSALRNRHGQRPCAHRRRSHQPNPHRRGELEPVQFSRKRSHGSRNGHRSDRSGSRGRSPSANFAYFTSQLSFGSYLRKAVVRSYRSLGHATPRPSSRQR